MVRYCLDYDTCFAEAPYSYGYSSRHVEGPFMLSLAIFGKLLGL